MQIYAIIKKVHSRSEKARVIDFRKEIWHSFCKQSFNFWDDLLGCECIQTRQVKTRRRVGWRGGEEKARKHI